MAITLSNEYYCKYYTTNKILSLSFAFCFCIQIFMFIIPFFLMFSSKGENQYDILN